MKPLILALFFLSPSAFALGQPAPIPTTRTLMKCFGAKNGTLWASFGTYVSGDQRKQFPSEVAVFTKELNARLFYPTIQEALNADFSVSQNLIHYGFTIEANGVRQEHLLQLLISDPRDPNSFSGNWTLRQADGTEYMDAAYCTVL